MGWPQIVMLAMMGANIGMNFAMDGKPREGKYSLLSAIFSTAIECAILYAGGFWK